MTCKTCNTRNPIGNKFCRECGEKLVIPDGSLAAEEAARAENERRAERAAVLLADAYLLAEQGKYLGAIPIAEEVVATMPQSTSAYALLATLYEHTNQQEKAISAQEQVVALNPASPADAERLERMRRGERTTVPPARTVMARGPVPTLRGGETPPLIGTASTPLPSWFPVAASAAVGGFALFLGFLALTPGSVFLHRNTTKTVVSNNISPAISASPGAPELALNPSATQPPPTDPVRGGDPFVPLDVTRHNLQAEAAQRAGTTNATLGTNVALPAPRSSPRGSNAPVILDITKAGNGQNRSDNDNTSLPPINASAPTGDSNNNDNTGFGAGERVTAAPPNGGTPSDTPAPPSNGYMRIKVGPPSQRPAPIVASAPTSQEKAPDMEGDPIRRARTLQSMERYGDAVSAYREAIAAGASAGDANEAIGLCYQRQGDYASAKSAYRQAISAYDSQITTGSNVAAAQRGINSCKAALEVLGGN